MTIESEGQATAMARGKMESGWQPAPAALAALELGVDEVKRPSIDVAQGGGTGRGQKSFRQRRWLQYAIIDGGCLRESTFFGDVFVNPIEQAAEKRNTKHVCRIL